MHRSAVKVAIEDAFGNIVLTNTTSVVLALASGPSGGVLSGTLSVHAAAGSEHAAAASARAVESSACAAGLQAATAATTTTNDYCAP